MWCWILLFYKWCLRAAKHSPHPQPCPHPHPHPPPHPHPHPPPHQPPHPHLHLHPQPHTWLRAPLLRRGPPKRWSSWTRSSSGCSRRRPTTSGGAACPPRPRKPRPRPIPRSQNPRDEFPSRASDKFIGQHPLPRGNARSFPWLAQGATQA